MKKLKHVKNFNESSDFSDSKKLNNFFHQPCNYIVSYTKENTKTDVDISISSDNLENLVKKLKSFLTENEFNSIFKIEAGIMSFG